MCETTIGNIKKIMGDKDFVHIDFSKAESKNVIFACFGGEEMCRTSYPELYTVICQQIKSTINGNGFVPIVLQDCLENNKYPYTTNGLSLEIMSGNNTEQYFIDARSVFAEAKLEMRHVILVVDSNDSIVQVVENIESNTSHIKTTKEVCGMVFGNIYNIYLLSFEVDEETKLAHMEILSKKNYHHQPTYCIATRSTIVTPYVTDTSTGDVVIQYNMGPLLIYDPDFKWPIMYQSEEYVEEKRQELVLDVVGNIYLDDDYEFSSVKNNMVTMKLFAQKGMAIFNNAINGTSDIQSCFINNSEKLNFVFPRVWGGVVPTFPLDMEDKAELLIQFTICALKKSTNKIVECEFSFCNSYDQTYNNGNICYTPLLTMVWGYFLL